MTPEESRRDEAARWLAQVRKDLNAARVFDEVSTLLAPYPQS
jgi:hypothetical protein